MLLSPNERIAGILAPLFALRTENDLGIGDVEGLRQFIDWSHRIGFRLVQLLQFAVQMLDPLNERTDSSAGNADVRHGASLLNEIVKMTAKTSPMG